LHKPSGWRYLFRVAGESVIASAARQSRWSLGDLQGRRSCYSVEIATAQAPRNDNLLNSEQLRLAVYRRYVIVC